MSRSYYWCERLPEEKTKGCKTERQSGYGEFILKSLDDCTCMYITKQSDSSRFCLLGYTKKSKFRRGQSCRADATQFVPPTPHYSSAKPQPQSHFKATSGTYLNATA